MIKLFQKKPEKRLTLFIAAALLAFFIFGAINIVYFLNFAQNQIARNNSESDAGIKTVQTTDPFITKALTDGDFIKNPDFSAPDPILGNGSSTVKIIIFSDFQCKYCQKQEKILRKVIANNDAALMWKDFPNKDVNSASFKAAVAARCANEQGKFWEYHDALYQENNLEAVDFSKIAKELGLKAGKFNDCLDDDGVKELIADDIFEANALNISGIPTVYINNKLVDIKSNDEVLNNFITTENEKN